jgi:hypothetical protein
MQMCHENWTVSGIAVPMALIHVDGDDVVVVDMLVLQSKLNFTKDPPPEANFQFDYGMRHTHTHTHTHIHRERERDCRVTSSSCASISMRR